MADDLAGGSGADKEAVWRWKRHAEAFTRLCLNGTSLAPELATMIPLGDRERFTSAVRVIHTQATEAAPNMDRVARALHTINRILSREIAAADNLGFLRSLISRRADKLTESQRTVLDKVWDHYVKTESPMPLRTVQHAIGKRRLSDVLAGLHGGLIYETQESDGRCLKLTFYGAFLTAAGAELGDSLIACLDFARELYEVDPHVNGFDVNQLSGQVGAEKTILLLRLLRTNLPAHFPLHISSVSNDRKSWSVAINDEIINLYNAPSTAVYADALLAAGYRDDEAIFFDERLANTFPVNEHAWLGLVEPKAPHPQAQGSGGTASYIDSERLLKLIGVTGPEYDCSRLVALCEELNQCAARRNSHAVIYLTRAILDHVPPVFGYRTFAEVAANYGGEKSFRKAMERLEKHSRHVADLYLHRLIGKREVVPTMSDVDFAAEINLMLSEILRRLT